MTTYSADKLLNDTAPEPAAATPTDDSVFGTPPPVEDKDPRGAVGTDIPPAAEPLDGEVIRADLPAVPGQDWGHELLEFKGDTLQVRCPSDQALTAFSLASGRFVPMEIKNDIVGLFVAKHLSLDSYGHVFSRLMDPDDDGYNPETIGELMRAIVGISVERKRAEEEAAKKAEDEAIKRAGSA